LKKTTKNLEETRIIDCPNCTSKVQANVIGEKVYGASDEFDPFRISYVTCPFCEQYMLGIAEIVQVSSNTWDYPLKLTRLYPPPPNDIDHSIPDIVRDSLLEARKCFSAGAYPACAVMCGRAIEAICVEFKTKNTALFLGLKELKDNSVIDARLFEWAETLRIERNLGAHASAYTPTKQDAMDFIDFAEAICEYVFVLATKYEEFKKRKKKKSK
jgi:hypothetical protein